jgi:GNAT superfamily N-acetyltransferase
VAILSNILNWADDRDRDAGDSSVEIRLANEPERLAAVRLILGGQKADINDRYVQDFIAQAPERGIDLAGIWVAQRGDQLILAGLPITSPGRTALIFTSACQQETEPTMARLLDAICQAARHEIDLAQGLLDPADETSRRAFAAAKFELMAELHYLQCTPRKDAAFPVLSPPLHWKNYSAENHPLFAATIMASYRDSLDCPALTGRRDIENVITGHKASGIFDPKLWHLLCDGDEPLGVLLLSPAGAAESVVELVYLGLTPAARGRGLGAIMMKQALATVIFAKHARLSLAVDSRNVPALKLYYRHGMDRFTARVALMCDLRKG